MRRRALLFLFLAVLAAGFGCRPSQCASEAARAFMAGTTAYENGDWEAAIAAFSRVVEEGVHNGLLFYNLGNAYLKNDNLGHAILWYERALNLIPEDPDLHFNYNYARSLTRDEQGDRTPPLLRILFFWNYQLSAGAVRWAALCFNAGLWAGLSVLIVRKKRLLRPSIGVLAAFTVLFSATALYNHYEASTVRRAVVLPDQVAVRSGFSSDATELFVLHAGTTVRVERESDTHRLIRYTEDKLGWVKKEAVGII